MFAGFPRPVHPPGLPEPCAGRGSAPFSAQPSAPRCRWRRLPPGHRTDSSRTRKRPEFRPAVRQRSGIRPPAPCRTLKIAWPAFPRRHFTSKQFLQPRNCSKRQARVRRIPRPVGQASQAVEKVGRFVILSDAKNRSLFVCLHLDRREILRFAQNDSILSFSPTCSAWRGSIATLRCTPVADSDRTRRTVEPENRTAKSRCATETRRATLLPGSGPRKAASLHLRVWKKNPWSNVRISCARLARSL